MSETVWERLAVQGSGLLVVVLVLFHPKHGIVTRLMNQHFGEFRRLTRSSERQTRSLIKVTRTLDVHTDQNTQNTQQLILAAQRLEDHNKKLDSIVAFNQMAAAPDNPYHTENLAKAIVELGTLTAMVAEAHGVDPRKFLSRIYRYLNRSATDSDPLDLTEGLKDAPPKTQEDK